jgi:hypothetical protein
MSRACIITRFIGLFSKILSEKPSISDKVPNIGAYQSHH